MKTFKLTQEQAKTLLENPRTHEGSKEYWSTPEKTEGSTIYFKSIPIQDLKIPGFLARWMSSLRAVSLTVTLIPTIFILCTGLKLGLKVDLYAAIAGVLIPSLLLLAVNVRNDVEDYKRLIDLPGTNGGSGVIQKGWISPKELLKFSWALIFISTGLAIPLILKNFALMIACLVATFVVVIGYSGKPFNFKYKALGDLVVFLMCGPVLTICYGLVTFNNLSPYFLWSGCFFGFLATTILHANNLNDINTDKNQNAITVANSIGLNASKYYMALLYIGAIVSLVFFLDIVKSYQLFLMIIPLFLTIRLMNKIISAKEPDQESLKDIRFVTPQIHLISGIIALTGLI